jgi:regulator of replication initiation timing
MSGKNRTTNNSNKSAPTSQRSSISKQISMNSTTPRSSVMCNKFDELNAKIDKLLENQDKLEKVVENLQQTVQGLQETNKSLVETNKDLKKDNTLLVDKLKSAEIALSSARDEFESVNQRQLRNTVEILDVKIGESENLLDFVTNFAHHINCNVTEHDISNIYSKTTHNKRNNTKNTKIVLEFISLRKRMNFYYSARTYRFNNTSDAGYRPIKVVDALTYSKREIFLNIIEERKKHRDIVKNVWISDGEIFIRRFATNVVEPVRNQEFVDMLFDVSAERQASDQIENQVL